MKRKTLRAKIDWRLPLQLNHWLVRKRVIDNLLRLVREEQRRRCDECLRVKKAIDAQIKKNTESCSRGDIARECMLRANETKI